MGRGKARQEITVGGESFYTAERAGKVLQVHYRTVMRYIKHGGLRAAKVGMYHYIAVSELRRFLTEGAAGPLPPLEPARPKPVKNALAEMQDAAHRKEGKGAK